MKSNRFYLACLRDTVGTNISFHCKDGCGYSTNIDMAHTYTREEAQSEWDRGREFDLPLCTDRVDALAEWHVDCQYIPCESTMVGESTLVDGCTKYVAYVEKRWNGNDVYWLSNGRMPTCNFELATVFEKPNNSEGIIWLPFEIANNAKRRTIDVNLINRRSMCQAAGLIMPSHVKRHRRRSNSGKTRWNCPSCGRIHWQHNPHDFDGCNNSDCDQWHFWRRAS